MIRRCNGSDGNLKTRSGAVGNCGAVFDDIDQLTICPHEEFSGPKAQAQAAAEQLLADVFGAEVVERIDAASDWPGQ